MSKRFVGAVSFGLAFLLASAAVAVAHHGDAMRYNEEVIVVTGTIVQIQLINPHTLLTFEVTEPGGKKVRWQAELGAPMALVREFRWTKDLIKVGDTITMTGRRPRSGANYLNLTERSNIVMTDTGKEIYRTENYGQPAPKQ
jgi:hypothetical protein